MATPLEIEMQDIKPALPLESLETGAKERNGHLTDLEIMAAKTISTSEMENNSTDHQPIGSAQFVSGAPSAIHAQKYRLFERIVEHFVKYLTVVCKFGNLPFQVDVENRRVYPTNSAIRWYLFNLISFVCLVKGLYVNGTLVASLLTPNWFQVLHLPVHIGLSLVSFPVLLYLFLRPNALRLSTVLLNAALAKRDRVKSFSRQQLILAVMPMGITSVAAVKALVFPLLTTIIYQFGTLLRVVATTLAISTSVHGFLRIVAYVLDGFPLFWICIGVVYGFSCQVLILEVLQSWCDGLRVKTTGFSLADCYSELVDVQIIIELFNQIFGGMVFFNKLNCFGTGIWAFVTVLWYGFSGHFVLAVVNLYIGMAALTLYPLMYEKAALISGSMETAKKSLLMATANLKDQNEGAFWRRRIKAIRVVCICCGPRPIERESLPLFYDFLFSNFISVLLTA